MTTIIAKKVTRVMDMEDSPMYSRSEKDDVIVMTSWDYELPDNHKFFKTIPTKGSYIPVVGDNEVIGYSCPVFYCFLGYRFDTYEDFMKEFPYDFPTIVREEDLEKTLEEQNSGEYYE